MASRSNIQARRKLEALFQRGVEVRFGPSGGRIGRLPGKGQPCFDDKLQADEVAVWISPPNPFQREMAMREAQAARAKALIALKREEGSEEYLTTRAFLAEMGPETVKDYILMHTADERRNEAMRDVLARDEWKEMVALQDAMRQYEEAVEQFQLQRAALEAGEELDGDPVPDPGEDPEFQALLEKDQEYGRQVQKRFEELTDAGREALGFVSREEIERRALERRGELVVNQRFLEEFERWMTYFSIRDPENHKELFFDHAREFSEQSDQVQAVIKEALGIFVSEGSEAKNSLGAVSGSNSSELPSEPETSEASTPEAASA